MGTTDGLNKYDYATDRFTRYSEKAGLPNNSINGLLADRNDNLWMSTNKGLSRFDPRAGIFKNFTVADGLQGDEFDQGAFAQGRDGRLYFGGAGGMTAFDPDSIRDNPFVAPVVITGFRVFERPVALGQADRYHVTLSYEEDFFSFEYSALDFTVPEKNQYLYKLEGYDKNWITAGTRRYASYTHLDAGEYVFRVKGSNSDGIWNEEGISVFMTILPPFWERWWFQALALAASLGLIYTIYRYRINKLLAVERTRNRIARDLHDDVSATLGGISYFAQAIHDETTNRVTSGSERFLSLIQESAAELQESMSDIIWSINPENDDWERVLAKFRRYGSDLFDSKNIKYQIDIPTAPRLRPLGMEKRRNFWLIYKEMVTNVVRHSECTEASVAITVTNGRVLRIRISDNGKGFDPSALTERSGNRNIRSRSDELHARLSLTTAPGAGTTWDLEFAP
jgi:signal transduction histidine kinase